MRFCLYIFLILISSLAKGQEPAYIRLAGPKPPPVEPIENLADPVKAGPESTAKTGGSGNDVCSEAVTLTVGNSFTCGSTSTNTAGSSFPNSCVSTSGSGIQQFRTDWYCFNSGSNKTLAIVMNTVSNSTSFTPAIAVFGPYSSCTAGCAASMSGPMCDNGLSFQSDSIKILENLTQNAYYMIAVVERRNNPDISGGRSVSYCISVQPTTLDDCEVPDSGCPATCGDLCVFVQATAPDVADVTANCVQRTYSHRIQGSSLTAQEDTVEFCYNFHIDTGCTVSFGGVITASGCVGPGNLTSASWRVYNSNTCGVVTSGTNVPIAATISAQGDYIFCFKYSAACVLQYGTWLYGYGTCVIINPVLPVELTAFEVTAVNGEHLLTWTTLSELNNNYYDVERSTDGSNFSRIGTVASKSPDGNSHSRLDYQFGDRQPLPGNNYYRLKQVDLNGDFTYSQIVAARKTSGDFRFLGNVFSTVSGSAAITFEDVESGPLNITVCDYTGKIISQGKFPAQPGINTYLLPARNLHQGVYIISLQRENGRLLTGKFFKF